MVTHKIYSDEVLNRKRLSGDPPADDFISIVFADPIQKLQLQKWMYASGGDNDSEPLENLFPEFEFIRSAQKLPSWAEPELMRTGSALFARHSEIIMSLLGLLSLPYCYTASHGAMVLYVSGRIQKQTTKRLYDTAIFVWDMMAPDAFVANGNAYNQILKVRIIHAAVRYYTLQSGKWDDIWGLPVNQEDMAGTNLSFSLIVLRGLKMLGFKIGLREQHAFLHTWAVIGYMTGLNEDLIPENQSEAQHLDEVIKRRQFRDSEHGKELTESLIAHILSVNTSKATPDDIKGLMRYLLGTEIADMLAITAPELPGYKLALIRTFNLVKSFIPKGNLRKNYTNAYAAFRKLNPELNKGI